MRVIVATFTASVALAAISVQAAPLAPPKATGAELGAAPAIELVQPRMRVGLAPRQVARPLGLLALGWLLPELVTSPTLFSLAAILPLELTDNVEDRATLVHGDRASSPNPLRKPSASSRRAIR